MKNRLIAAFLILTTAFSFECYSTKPVIYTWPGETVNYKLLTHLKRVKIDIKNTLQHILATEAEWTQTAESKEEYIKVVHIWQDIKDLIYSDEKLKTMATENDQALLALYINGLFNEEKTLEELADISRETTTIMFVINALNAQNHLEPAIKFIFTKYYPNHTAPVEEIMNYFFTTGDYWLVEVMIYAKAFFNKLIPIIDAKIAELDYPSQAVTT